MELLLALLSGSAIALVALFGAALLRGRAARPLRWCGAALALGQAGIAGYLWSVDWRLAADVVLVALPPLLAAVAFAPPVGHPAPWRRRTATVAALLHGHAIVSPPAPPYLADAALTLAALVVAAGLAWLWQHRVSSRVGRGLRITLGAATVAGVVAAGFAASAASRLPAVASMTDHGHAGGVDISTLTGPRDGVPDRRHTLTARTARVTLASGERVDAWTFDGTLPGPELRVRQGDLVEVTLINADVPAGVTIHWHGLDVPNAEDGVAGLTQDAVQPGGRHVYRFVADQVGTFWYHSHQQSDKQVRRGLFGALVVEPRTPAAAADLVVLAHAWPSERGQTTALSVAAATPSTETLRQQVKPGSRVRLRLVNADNEPRVYAVAGTPFRVAAIDGTELSGPTELTGQQLLVGGGARYDVELTMPPRTVQLAITRDDNDDDADVPTVLLSPDGAGEPRTIPPGPVLDPAGYGTPADTPFGVDSAFDRTITLLLGETVGFYNGQLGQWTTINGNVYPDTPVLAVRHGDLVRVTFLNRGFEDHPMHLHGHHMLVLSRDDRPVTGSPWWTDTLNVAPGERYEVAFRADNPGLWMDHCHNLEHAADGMSMHLMYLGYHTSYRVGPATGNQPE